MSRLQRSGFSVQPARARIALVFLLVSCGGVAQREPGGGGGDFSSRNLCETMAEEVCRFLYQCCIPAERDTMLSWLSWIDPQEPHSTEEDCVDAYRKTTCLVLDPYSQAALDGRAQWNKKHAKACWGFIKEGARECDAQKMVFGLEDAPDDCITGLITGEVEEGGICYLAEECAAQGSVCVPNEPTDPAQTLVTAKGTCDGPPRNGEECLAGGVCADGHFCDLAVDPAICRTQKPVGEACNDAGECETAICNAGSCGAKLANGEECVAAGECESGFCDAEPNPAVCADQRITGADCTYDAQCVSGMCQDSKCVDPSAAVDIFFDICKG